MIDTSVTHTNPLLNENEDQLLEKLKMSSLTITEPQLHSNTLLDEAHTNSLPNKNKKLKKNNKELIIEPDDDIEQIEPMTPQKIENELSKKLIDISTSDIQDNTIKQLSEKGLKENNISNISQDKMATHTYTPVNVTDVKVGDFIQYQYETRDKKTGDGVMTSKCEGWIEKITPKIIVIDTFHYKKEKLQNLQLIKKIDVNVDEPDTEIVPEIQTTYPETDMMSENNEMNEDKEEDEEDEEDEEQDDDEEQDEEEQHKEQLEAHGYSTCERCEKDLPKEQISDEGLCFACNSEEQDEDEEDEEQEDEEQDDDKEQEESEEDKVKREIAEMEKKIAEKKAKLQEKEIAKSNEEREKEFQSYSRDMKTINRIRQQYASKIIAYARKINAPDWIIGNIVWEDLCGEYYQEIDDDGDVYETWNCNDLDDESIEEFRKKHLDQMRKEFFKGVGEPKGEKKTDMKRKAPTKLCRESNRLFRDGELIRHIATKKGDKQVLNTLFCYYDKNADKFILCDNKKKPMNFEGVGEIKNLNQFIIVNNKKYVPEKVQKETAWAGSVTIYRENKWVSVGKIEPIA